MGILAKACVLCESDTLNQIILFEIYHRNKIGPGCKRDAWGDVVDIFRKEYQVKRQYKKELSDE